MEAMDDLRKAGIEDIGLITEKKEAKPATREASSHGARTQALRRREGRHAAKRRTPART